MLLLGSNEDDEDDAAQARLLWSPSASALLHLPPYMCMAVQMYGEHNQGLCRDLSCI
jgi:hypothetical protein